MDPVNKVINPFRRKQKQNLKLGPKQVWTWPPLDESLNQWIIGIRHAPSFVINFFQVFFIILFRLLSWLFVSQWTSKVTSGSLRFRPPSSLTFPPCQRQLLQLVSHNKRFVWISHRLLTEGSLELQPLGTLNDLIYSPVVKRLAFPLSLCARTKTQDVWRPHGLQMSYWAAFTHIVVWLNSVLADDSFPELIISPLDSLQKEQIMQIRTF